MTLQPYLFSSDRALVSALGHSGPDRVGAVVVDWERLGKQRRQMGALDLMGTDTQINADGPEDLEDVCALARVPVICRLNAWTPASPDELETAIACGASEVLLPMVRTTDEVTAALDAARGRVGVGIMVETTDAIRMADRLGELPITRAYLGMMDLAIERKSSSIFDAISDGTVERVRDGFDVPFGFGGLTVPGCGNPVPVRLLAAELVRLGCAFTFLRRSFIRDAAHAPGPGLQSMLAMLEELESRGSGDIDADHRELIDFLHDLDPAAPGDSTPTRST